MDPAAADPVRQSLDRFMEQVADESYPSEEGWRLWDELVESVEVLGDLYGALGASEELADEPDEEPEWGDTDEEVGRDNIIVDFFHRTNENWDRYPGDPLTLRQKLDMFGQTFMIVLVVGLIILVGTYVVIHADEFTYEDHPFGQVQ